jgi:tetratricopeptide (TPR) repeat protein
MAEMAAGAILAGDDVDDLSLKDVDGMEGVEEAVTHILSHLYRRARLEVRAEHERLWGELPHGAPGHGQPGVEGDERATPIAHDAVERYMTELERGVRGAAAALKAKEGPGIWRLPKGQIADLIYARVAPPEQGPSNPGREQAAPPRQDAEGKPAAGAAAADPTSASGSRDAGWDAGQARHLADSHVLLGNELEPEAAIEEYQKALAIDPNHVMAHFFLAEAFQNVGNLEAAVAEFSQVTRLSPNDADGHWSLGDALEQIGELEAAAREYACTLKLAPNDESILEGYSSLSPEMKSRVGRQKAGGPKPAQTG